MFKIFRFLILTAFFVIDTQSAVKYQGIKSSLSVEDINTPYGKSYLKHYYDYRIIFPGTKWCGNGDIAEDYDDLGYFEETDSCCRDHDNCDDVILAGETKHGLHNDGSYTRLHCKCDLAFYNCLSNSTCNCAGIVAVSYFNALDTQCYDYTYPATCILWDEILGMRSRCAKYTYWENYPKRWQWFDIPRYILGPDDDLLQ